MVSSPFDVVKSRVMGQPLNPDGTGKLYGGMVDCFAKSSQTARAGEIPTRRAPRASVWLVGVRVLRCARSNLA